MLSLVSFFSLLKPLKIILSFSIKCSQPFAISLVGCLTSRTPFSLTKSFTKSNTKDTTYLQCKSFRSLCSSLFKSFELLFFSSQSSESKDESLSPSYLCFSVTLIGSGNRKQKTMSRELCFIF